MHLKLTTIFQLESRVEADIDVVVGELLKGPTPKEEFDKSVKACASFVVTPKPIRPTPTPTLVEPEKYLFQ